MSEDRLREELARRAGAAWELYRKRGESREIDADAAGLRRHAVRREEGWAARWWEEGAARFAAASSTAELSEAIRDAGRARLAAEDPPEWPAHRSEAPPDPPPVESPPDLFDELASAVGAAARGEAALAGLSLRRGTVKETIVNGAGLDVAQSRPALGGVAHAVGRRGARAREVRVPFQWDGGPDTGALARRLSDAAALPLGEPGSAFPTGQWLLDPAVAATILATLAPGFCAERPPLWMARDGMAAPTITIADDASRDAPFDGEGSRTRRVVLVVDGRPAGRLDDLRSAARGRRRSTGHGVRPSYRTPPSLGPRRIFLEAAKPTPRAELLSRVTRGVFASALTAPVRLDLPADRYEIEFTGFAIVGGRAQGVVPAARSRGRISELLRRIAGASDDLQFFPMPFPAGSPTLLIERASFE